MARSTPPFLLLLLFVLVAAAAAASDSEERPRVTPTLVQCQPAQAQAAANDVLAQAAGGQSGRPQTGRRGGG